MAHAANSGEMMAGGDVSKVVMGFFRKTALMAGAASCAVFVVDAPQAYAESNLLRDMFNWNRKRKNRQQQVVAPRLAKPRKAVRKVKAPSFFTYRAAGLVSTDFSKVIGTGAAPDVLLPVTFYALASAHLDDFDLQAEKDIAAAIADYYAQNRAFVWVNGLAPSEKARAVHDMLAKAGDDGLVAADYAVSMPAPDYDAGAVDARMKELVRFEMAMTARVLRYLRDVSAGRVDPNKLSGYHDLPVHKMDYAASLDALSGTADALAWLASMRPDAPYYTALRKELAALRASEADEIVIDRDLFMKPGSTHVDFPKLIEIIRRDAGAELLEEQGALLTAAAGSETYDRALVPLIKAVQKSHGLNPDGIIGRQTVGALSPESRTGRIRKVEMAMERLRWLPRELGARRVFINQPEFRVRYYEEGREKLGMRVVVGKPSNQTNFFYDEIERVDFNPYWGVPRSILVNEMLPKLLADPSYLDRKGYEVTNRRGQKISSTAVNWRGHGSNIPYDVRQKPGRSNALGELKIMFPNKHLIYMHDTPAKSLFQRDARAYSHGCVRLQHPRKMAAAVLGTSVDSIGTEIAKGHSSRNVPENIPVYVAYFTAWPDKDGVVNYFGDIYARDKHLAKALAAVEGVRAPSS